MPCNLFKRKLLLSFRPQSGPKTEPKFAKLLSHARKDRVNHTQSEHSALCVPHNWSARHLPVAEFTALLYRLSAWSGGGEKYTPMQAS